MNLEDIEQILARKIETRNVDFKAGFKWCKENRDLQLELLRDLMAMANTRDGGAVILGVADGDYEVVGVDQEILDSFDVTDVAQMLHDNSSPKVTVHLLKTKINGKSVIVINAAEFEEVPIVCADTRKDLKGVRVILRKSALYVRTTAARTEEVSSDQEMRELIERAITKKGSKLLGSVEQMLQGKIIAPAPPIIDRFSKELSEADQWFMGKLQKGFLASAHWEFIIHPSEYRAAQISSIGEIRPLIQNCWVNLRGWTFPYVGTRAETSNFNHGLQSFTDSSRKREAFRFYQSGLFVWKQALWEDLNGDDSPKRHLSFITAIYSVTEWLLFSGRLAEQLKHVESFRITIRLVGTKGRRLASYEAEVPMLPNYRSDESVILVERDLGNAQLQSGATDVAKEIARHIFQVFNWTGYIDDAIEHWQQKLLARGV